MEQTQSLARRMVDTVVISARAVAILVAPKMGSLAVVAETASRRNPTSTRPPRDGHGEHKTLRSNINTTPPEEVTSKGTATKHGASLATPRFLWYLSWVT